MNVETIEREMSISHDDFFRILPKALDSYSYEVLDSSVSITLEQAEILIVLSRESSRSIASLTLPVTKVTFRLKNVAEKLKKDFFHQFDRSFQRGGG